ncbi:hypothetical protein CDAR_395181 [Caerostris darwini]|uniref:Uncharacterized protein n=1 Tax=Caerostris darwini TaxID=1538125 RepID=A0AAV4QEH8_9ARAC|nr:hypothetical protein CDAR_395181 [Caerostris darwini]
MEESISEVSYGNGFLQIGRIISNLNRSHSQSPNKLAISYSPDISQSAIGKDAEGRGRRRKKKHSWFGRRPWVERKSREKVAPENVRNGISQICLLINSLGRQAGRCRASTFPSENRSVLAFFGRQVVLFSLSYRL